MTDILTVSFRIIIIIIALIDSNILRQKHLFPSQSKYTRFIKIKKRLSITPFLTSIYEKYKVYFYLFI